MLQEGEDLTLNGNESYWDNIGQGADEGVAYSYNKVSRLGTKSSAYSNNISKGGIYSLTVMGHNCMDSEARNLELGVRNNNGTITPLLAVAS